MVLLRSIQSLRPGFIKKRKIQPECDEHMKEIRRKYERRQNKPNTPMVIRGDLKRMPRVTARFFNYLLLFGLLLFFLFFYFFHLSVNQWLCHSF